MISSTTTTQMRISLFSIALQERNTVVIWPNEEGEEGGRRDQGREKHTCRPLFLVSS